MILKNPQTLRNVTAFICALVIAVIVSVHGYVQNGYNEPVPVPAIHQQLNAQMIADFVVDNMPNSPLRANLLTVFAAEYAGSSEELNEILQAYSEMKIQEMSKDKSL